MQGAWPGGPEASPSAELGPKPARRSLGSSTANRRPGGGPGTVFPLGATGGEAIQGAGPGRGRGPGGGVAGPRGRAARRPGGRGRRPPQLGPRPAVAVYRSRRGPGDSSHRDGKGPVTLVTARRAASPGLAHATLADDEDLQGGQHVFVHPDPAPLGSQLAAPLRLSALPQGELPRMRPAPPGPPSFHTGCLGCRSPARPGSAWR